MFNETSNSVQNSTPLRRVKIQEVKQANFAPENIRLTTNAISKNTESIQYQH